MMNLFNVILRYKMHGSSGGEYHRITDVPSRVLSDSRRASDYHIWLLFSQDENSDSLVVDVVVKIGVDSASASNEPKSLACRR